MKSFTIGTLFLAIGSASANVCGQNAFDNSGPSHDPASLPAYTIDTNANTAPLCSALCKSDSKCQSFAVGKETCLLYPAPAENNITPDDCRREPSRSPYYFYEASCEVTSSSPPLLHSSPTCGTQGYDRGNPGHIATGSLYTVDTLKRAADECRAMANCTAFALISNNVSHRGAGVDYYSTLVDNFDANSDKAGTTYNFYELSYPSVSA
jgi:hypothetical protein